MNRRLSFLMLSGVLACGSVAPLAGKEKSKEDLNAIINSSYSFLKNREPEMTAGEYAIYQKVVAMASANAEFALKLMETMMGGTGPGTAAFEFVTGNIYYTNHKLPEAEAHYKTALAKYPDYTRAWANLGILYYAQQRFAEAIPCFSKAVSLGDKESSTLGLLATCHNKAGNILAAEIAYSQALAIDPANDDWVKGLLELYLQAKYYPQAESIVKQLLKANPKDPQHWLIYANILIAQNRKFEAIAALETLVSLGNTAAEPVLLLGDLYAEQKLFSEAVTNYRAALANSPDLGTKRLLNYAEILVSQNHPEEAESLLEKIEHQADPKHRTEILQWKAAAAAARKDWPEARKRYEVLVAEAPMNGEGLLGLGEVCKNQGDLVHAEFAFEQAARIPEHVYLASVQLANLAVKAQKYHEAIRFIEQALASDKNPALQDYLTKIQAMLPANSSAR